MLKGAGAAEGHLTSGQLCTGFKKTSPSCTSTSQPEERNVSHGWYLVRERGVLRLGFGQKKTQNPSLTVLGTPRCNVSMETQSIIENKRKQHRRSEIGVTKGGIRPSGGNAGVFE